MSQGQVRQREYIDPYVLISIQDPGESPLAFDESRLRFAVLALQFDDIERPERGKVLFTNTNALDILDFITEHKGTVTTIACHCKVGMSRSPAVIAALAELLGCGDVLADPRGKQKYRPNKHVYETLLQAGRRHAICDFE